MVVKATPINLEQAQHSCQLYLNVFIFTKLHASCNYCLAILITVTQGREKSFKLY